MTVGAALIEADAVNGAPVLVESPHAQAIDL
jgi:hypothetical protein